jgi:hypothetical protein
MGAPFRVKLADLGAVFARRNRRLHDELVSEVRNDIAREFFLDVVEHTPVDTGKARASNTASAGAKKLLVLGDLPSHPIPGREVVDGAAATASPQDTLWISNAAQRKGRSGIYAYFAWALEPGRRMYSRLATGKSQYIGSDQAPMGIYGPAYNRLRARLPKIAKAAAARVRARP